MAINKTISSQNAVIQAKEELGLEGTNKFDGLFKLWARRCDDRIGTTETSLKPRTICAEIENCRIELPCDTVAVHPVIIFGEISCDDCVGFVSYLQTTLHFNNSMQRGEYFYSFAWNGFSHQAAITDFTIRDNKIIFNNKTLNGKTVSVIIQARETDENGYVMVHQLYNDAIVEYIRWQYARRSQFTGNPVRFSRGDLLDLSREYHRLVRVARGEAAYTSPEGQERIKNMINSPFSGSGHLEWMFNNTTYSL